MITFWTLNAALPLWTAAGLWTATQSHWTLNAALPLYPLRSSLTRPKALTRRKAAMRAALPLW